MSCMPDVTATILLSYLAETKKFSMFLIKRDKPFLRTMMMLCNSLLSQSDITCFIVFDNEFSRHLSLVLSLILILSFQCEDGPKTLQMKRSKLCSLNERPGEFRGPRGPEKKSAKLEVRRMNFYISPRNPRSAG